MGMIESLRFDFLATRMKIQTQKLALMELSSGLSEICQVPSQTLFDLMQEGTSGGIGLGVAVLDIRSSKILHEGVALISLEDGLEIETVDDIPVDLIAAVVSPLSFGPSHLQRLAAMTRLLRSEDLCAALRDAQDVDTMQVLLTPAQRWTRAA